MTVQPTKQDVKDYKNIPNLLQSVQSTITLKITMRTKFIAFPARFSVPLFKTFPGFHPTATLTLC